MNTRAFFIYITLLAMLFGSTGAVALSPYARQDIKPDQKISVHLRHVPVAVAEWSSAYLSPFWQADLDAQVEAILTELSVEERVGQLFMINFVGQNAYPADAISKLILEYKIGGVYLTENNNNIDNDLPENEDTLAQVANLTNQLQTRAYEATHHQFANQPGGLFPDDDFFLPLFVAIDHEGDGYPHTRLRNGFTPIPSTMSLGATWDTSAVEAVGDVIGRELAAVGVNMLLGPVVDVLEKPHPEGSGDINIRALGGSPFWVGLLGRAYVRGVHLGSDGRVLTIAKHFPGHGASDRLPDFEVATVHKSLAELQGSDLIPFFAVTQANPADLQGITDGLMPSHIRYKGFQPDVDQLTRPISLDPEGMEAFMALSPLAEWRKGGLVVCDSLGVLAVKRYYDPTLQTFPAKQVAKDALMAGNDVLPLVKFAAGSQPGWFSEQMPTITETVTFFQKEYQEDELFQRRVDDAVRHILRAKLRLYPRLTLDNVLVTGNVPLGQGDQVTTDVARKSLTLLYPDPDNLPAPPRSDEDILIMGCFEECLVRVRIRGDTVRDALLDLYGPAGSDLIDPERVHLLDFMQLYQFMSGQLEESEDAGTVEEQAKAILEQVQSADWILLILVNYMPDTQPQTGAARLFLRDARFDLRDTKVVALALHAPYYLDATETGKLSAYYAVYSKIEPSLQVALRALFQEITPAGASPVSVEGIGYELATALRPDPDQTLRLTLDTSAADIRRPGDEVRVRTGPMLDHNGHPVPDGTELLFQADYADLPISLSPSLVTDTVDGVAWAVFRPTEAGRLEISASSDGVQAEPVSLLIAPLAPTGEPIPSATATRPTVRPTAATPPPTETIAPPTETSPAPTATTASIPQASATGEPSPQGKTFPAVPALIVLAGLLALASLGLLWYRSRIAPPPAGPADADLEETGTISTDLAALTPTLTGHTLGSCQVGQKLGEGGMGQVYKGYHPLLDRSVAIKILPPALVESKEMRARFLQEARIAAALRHPNIVQIYDFGEQDDFFYMMMEYVDGTNLKRRLVELRETGEIMPMTEAVGIARQIAEALAYAHAHDAVHRDLKPANILLTQSGQAILVDFGLAVLRGGPRYTEPGQVWGSPTYIAPEQLGDPPHVDARSDIYALGILLYEMTTGRPPFKANSVMEVLWQQANVAPRPPRQLAPDLPPALEGIILKALAKDPGERYATAQELAEALGALDR